MGAKQSKVSDPKNVVTSSLESSSKNVVRDEEDADIPSMKTIQEQTSIDDSVPSSSSEQQQQQQQQSSGGCPMKGKSAGYFGGFLKGGKNPHVGPNAIPMSTDKSNNVTDNCKNSKDEGSSCPVDTKNSTASSGCPVKMDHNSKNKVQYNVYSQPIDPNNNMPVVENQLPTAQQKVALSTNRVSSNIPKGGADGAATWTYPSPQMFYNSLARKNKLDDTEESDIESVVAIHNNMNEKTWGSVVEWESVVDPEGHKQGGPKLLKFMGRPSDLSPKARWKHMILGHPLPFDRHDWTIVRPDGTEVRYVIDYYMDESMAKETEESALPKMEDREAVKSILVDVRPAMDSPSNLIERGIVMPYARNVAKTTSFKPMPLMPTNAMKDQLGESEKTWESIQKNVQVSKGGVTKEPKSMVLTREQIEGKEDDDNANEKHTQITKEEAVKVALSFAAMLTECRNAQQIVDQCTDDAECARASLGLSLCMAKLVCPLQHKAVTTSLNSDDLDENDEKSEEIYDKRVAATLANVSDCLALEGYRAAMAKKQYPEVFQ